MSRPASRPPLASRSALACCCAPAPLAAQAKDDFVRALIDLSQAVGGATGR